MTILHPATAARLDVIGALEQELASPPGLVPVSALELAVRLDPESHAEAIRGQAGSVSLATPALTMLAPKPKRGMRPLSLMTLEQRVWYRSLANVVAQAGASSRRGSEDYSRMNEGALERRSNSHIVLSDVAAFYEYVDFDVLEDEVVLFTADADLGRNLRALLAVIMGRDFGLPQVHDSSDLLSDIVIDRVERRLLRDGVDAWRYNDDFRLGATSRPNANRALETLQLACREVGLTLNDEKTFTLPRADFVRYLTRPHELWTQLTEDVDDEFRNFDPYTGEPLDPDAAFDDTLEPDPDAAERHRDRVAHAALGAIRSWYEWSQEGESNALEEAIYRRLLGLALTALHAAPRPLDETSLLAIIRREPYLTSRIARLLRRLDEDASTELLESISHTANGAHRFLSDWQVLWLSQVPRSFETASDDVVKWLRRAARSPSPMTSAHAWHTLSILGVGKPDDIAAALGQVPPAARPELLAALYRRTKRTSRLAGAARREGPESRAIHDWVADGN